MPTPHDHLVKQAFADLAVTRAFLRGVLPAGLLKAIDLSTLRQAPASLVDEQLDARHLDLLFQVQRRRGGGPLLLHLLLEHQSTPDYHMGRRLLRYVHHVWTQHERSHPTSESLLPPVVSIVVYHGAEPWPGERRLHDHVSLEGLPRGAARYVPDFTYLLVDLQRMTDGSLVGTAFGRLVLLMLKHAAKGDLWQRLPGWIDLLARVWRAPDGAAAMTAVVSYISRTTAVGPSADVKDMIRTKLGEPAMDVFVSWADKLIAEGEARGLAEGVARGQALGEARGEARGLLEGRRLTLLHLARARFGPLPPAFTARVEAADNNALDLWSLRLLTASSLEEIVA
jgi:predicted transposase YdaD